MTKDLVYDRLAVHVVYDSVWVAYEDGKPITKEVISVTHIYLKDNWQQIPLDSPLGGKIVRFTKGRIFVEQERSKSAKKPR